MKKSKSCFLAIVLSILCLAVIGCQSTVGPAAEISAQTQSKEAEISETPENTSDISGAELPDEPDGSNDGSEEITDNSCEPDGSNAEPAEEVTDYSCDPYTSFLGSVSNDGLSSAVETTLWTDAYFGEGCEQEAELDVLGYGLKGRYYNSITEKYNSYTTRIYNTESGIRFAIRADNGEPVLLNLMNKEFFDTEPYLDDIENAKEYSLEYARQTAAYFLGDLEGYLLLEGEPITQDKEKDGRQYSIEYYMYTFYKTVAGYDSTDFITVRVTSKGHLVSVLLGDIGAFSGRTFEIDAARLQDSVYEKVYDLYKDLTYEVKGISIDKQTIVKAPDGRYYINSDVGVELLDNDVVFSTKIGVITSIE